MWVKFSILMLVAVFNIVLGLIILFRNQNKDKSKLYFSLMCFSAGLWSIASSLIQIVIIKNLFIWIDRFIYVFTSFSILFFIFFSHEFPYRKSKFLIVWKIFIIFANLGIIFLVLSNKFIYGVYRYKNVLYQLESKSLNLVYGLYFLIFLIYAYYLLFRKYFDSNGVNKKNILFIIIYTFFPFIFSIFFSWYLPYTGKHYLYWIGPIFVVFMNVSIAYLLFKKIDE